MTRKQCEMMLVNIMELAYSVYKCYNPKGENLSLVNYNGQININDALTDSEGNFIDTADYDNAHSVYITKFADGRILNGSDWRRLFATGANLRKGASK